MSPTISIVVAIFNRKDELFELLTSFISQTDKDFEVIIVDDGSLVDLRPVIENFEGFLDIKYFRKDNSGPGLSRNYGSRRAGNEWLVFVDSDVIVENDYIENIKKDILEIPCDAFGGADKAHKGFNLMQKAISYSMTSVFTTGGIRGNKKAVSKFQPRSFNMGVKKEVFEKVGGFSEMRIGEDPDLSMTLWENGYTTAFFRRYCCLSQEEGRFWKIFKAGISVRLCKTYSQPKTPELRENILCFPNIVFTWLHYGFPGIFYHGKRDHPCFLRVVYFHRPFSCVIGNQKYKYCRNGSNINLHPDVFLWLWLSKIMGPSECFQDEAGRCIPETFS